MGAQLSHHPVGINHLVDSVGSQLLDTLLQPVDEAVGDIADGALQVLVQLALDLGAHRLDVDHLSQGRTVVLGQRAIEPVDGGVGPDQKSQDA